MTRHPGTWLVWAIAAFLVASSSVHPFVSVTTLAVALTLASSLVPRTERGPLRIVLIVGAIFVAIRVALFTLTGRAGSTTLLTLPEAELPALLGGVKVGGRLSLEVLVTEVADGVRLLAILATTAALVTLTDATRLVRLAPRRLRHVAVVVQVAVGFLPSLAASAREVREAQLARGLTIRGPGGRVALVVPVLAGAVDRAFALAETLHVRGFDRGTWSRYRADPFSIADRLIVAASCIAAVVGLVSARSAGGAWTAYPVAIWPALDLWLLVGPMLLAMPVLIPTSRDHPVMDEVVA